VPVAAWIEFVAPAHRCPHQFDAPPNSIVIYS
jgi:hypothetical protein